MSDEQRKALEEKVKNMSPEELKEFQKQQCIFCQIISKKIPAKVVYEDDKSMAVLDINPAAKGHILILPKEHYAILPQVSSEDLSHLFLVSKYMSQILLKTLRVEGTNIFIANGMVAGQRAQHVMIHLIPRKEGDKVLDLSEKLIDEKLRAQVQELIRKRLLQLLGVKKESQATLDSTSKGSSPKPESAAAELEAAEEAAPLPETKPARVVKKSKKAALSSGEKATTTSKEDDEDISLDDIANLFK